ARIYSELAAAGHVDFVGVHDIASETARKIAEKHKVRAFDSVSEAASASDALSIVTPTTSHYDLAKPLLRAGKHLLIEKPMTDDAGQEKVLSPYRRSISETIKRKTAGESSVLNEPYCLTTRRSKSGFFSKICSASRILLLSTASL